MHIKLGIIETSPLNCHTQLRQLSYSVEYHSNTLEFVTNRSGIVCACTQSQPALVPDARKLGLGLAAGLDVLSDVFSFEHIVFWVPAAAGRAAWRHKEAAAVYQCSVRWRIRLASWMSCVQHTAQHTAHRNRPRLRIRAHLVNKLPAAGRRATAQPTPA